MNTDATQKPKVGRPRLIQSVEDFERLADDYFTLCEQRDKPPTITGLILHLGLSRRSSLAEYEKRPEFTYTVKRVKSRVEDYYESQLTIGRNPAGAIFALKNFGWSDKQHVHHSGGINLSLAERLKSAREKVDTVRQYGF